MPMRCFVAVFSFFFFFSSRRRHTRLQGDWSSDVCSSDLLRRGHAAGGAPEGVGGGTGRRGPAREADRKSTRLNSSHLVISYAVFCLKKKKKIFRSLFVVKKKKFI